MLDMVEMVQLAVLAPMDNKVHKGLILAILAVMVLTAILIHA